MKDQNVDITGTLKHKTLTGDDSVDCESRPVKWVRERENVWRVVYIDGGQQ